MPVLWLPALLGNKDKAPEVVLFLSCPLKVVWPHGESAVQADYLFSEPHNVRWTRTWLFLSNPEETEGAVTGPCACTQYPLCPRCAEAVSARLCCSALCLSLEMPLGCRTCYHLASPWQTTSVVEGWMLPRGLWVSVCSGFECADASVFWSKEKGLKWRYRVDHMTSSSSFSLN